MRGLERRRAFPDKESEYAADLGRGEARENLRLGVIGNLHQDFRHVRRALHPQQRCGPGSIALMNLLSYRIGVRRVRYGCWASASPVGVVIARQIDVNGAG